MFKFAPLYKMKRKPQASNIVQEVKFSLILNYITIIWGGASPLLGPHPQKKL